MPGPHSPGPSPVPDPWPALPLADWADTYATLHRWAQVVGKVRLARTPWINHSWHATHYVTARGFAVRITRGVSPVVAASSSAARTGKTNPIVSAATARLDIVPAT